MNYLSYIVPAYCLAIGTPVWMGFAAMRRLRVARRQLHDLDPAPVR